MVGNKNLAIYSLTTIYSLITLNRDLRPSRSVSIPLTLTNGKLRESCLPTRWQLEAFCGRPSPQPKS